MANFVNQERFLVLLRQYQFNYYDAKNEDEIKHNKPHKCEEQILSVIESKKKLLKEKEIPYEERLPTGFQQEKRTDEMLDSLMRSMDNYIEFKKICLENHKLCHSNLMHRKRTDEILLKLEKELGTVVDRMVKEVFKKWFGGYTNYYKTELISHGTFAMWEKLTNFNIEFSFPFSYYTTTIKRAMTGFLTEFHDHKKTTMSLSVFEDINSA